MLPVQKFNKVPPVIAFVNHKIIFGYIREYIECNAVGSNPYTHSEFMKYMWIKSYMKGEQGADV